MKDDGKNAETPKVLTIGEIAKRFDCPIHKVEYLTMSRNIKPIQRAGRYKIYSEDSLKIIRNELENINACQKNKKNHKT